MFVKVTYLNIKSFKYIAKKNPENKMEKKYHLQEQQKY